MEQCDISTLMCMNMQKEKDLPIKLPLFKVRLSSAGAHVVEALRHRRVRLKLENNRFGEISLFKQRVKHYFSKSGSQVTLNSLMIC